jgi:hypothetical protein
MKAFEVYLNGKRLCIAGIGEFGVIGIGLSWRGSQPLRKGGPPLPERLGLNVGGIEEPTGNHVLWGNWHLKTGDDIRFKIVETSVADEPKERKGRLRNATLQDRKRACRRMAKEFGWKLEMKRGSSKTNAKK